MYIITYVIILLKISVKISKCSTRGLAASTRKIKKCNKDNIYVNFHTPIKYKFFGIAWI